MDITFRFNVKYSARIFNIRFLTSSVINQDGGGEETGDLEGRS